MYNYITGEIKFIKTNYIVIENNKIGYKVFVSNPFSYKLKEDITIFLYNHIREDELSLYGFKTDEELNLFLKLLSVKGLGPKVAMPFFALGSLNGIIEAINNENITYLKKFPKVGDKLAKQIILDLKGKLDITISSGEEFNDDLPLVLESLGYKTIDIKRILGSVDKTKKLEEQVKEALKLLMK